MAVAAEEALKTLTAETRELRKDLDAFKAHLDQLQPIAAPKEKGHKHRRGPAEGKAVSFRVSAKGRKAMKKLGKKIRARLQEEPSE